MSKMMPSSIYYHTSKHHFHQISNFKDIETSITYDACMHVPLVS